MHMTLWKFWGFAVFVLLWFVIMAGHFAGLPKGGLLDAALSEAQVREALRILGEADGDMAGYHAWGTRTLDMIFPALLGAFLLTGLSRYVTQAFLLGLGALTLLYVVTDYYENWRSLQLLAGGDAFAANAWASLVKYLAVALPLGIVAAGLVRETYKTILVSLGRKRQN